MLSAGKYCVVPFSFGHWTKEGNTCYFTLEFFSRSEFQKIYFKLEMYCYFTEHKDIFYNFTLSIYSSRELSCSPIRPPNYSNILADALISCANKYGKKKRYSLKVKYDDIFTISLNMGSGYCTVLGNHSSKYVELQMNSRTGQDYVTTRGSFNTSDKIAPNHWYVNKYKI